MIGSVNSGLPVSQHLEFGGPFDVAEQGDALRAPGGTVVDVTAIGAGGGEGGADDTLLCKEINKRKSIKTSRHFADKFFPLISKRNQIKNETLITDPTRCHVVCDDRELTRILSQY